MARDPIASPTPVISVVHEDDVRRLDRRVRAERAHRDADVRAHEDRRVVDPVADEGEPLALGQIGGDLFDLRDLLLGQELGVDGVDPGLRAMLRAIVSLSPVSITTSSTPSAFISATAALRPA